MAEYCSDGLLVYSNAGHIPPILFRRNNKEMFELEIHGSPIGLFEDEMYGSNQINLSKGDVLVVFTDGVPEMRNRDDEFFGVERLKKVIFENSDKSALEICDVIVDEVMKFKGEAEQKDDITLLVVKKI